MADRIDIEALQALFVPQPETDCGRVCGKCGEEYRIESRDIEEPTVFCDNCAHLLCEGTLPQLLAEIREHRVREANGGWVATSERIPDSPQPVWCVRHGVVFKAWGLGNGAFITRDGEYWRDVSHWMPRYVEPTPKPPETET